MTARVDPVLRFRGFLRDLSDRACSAGEYPVHRQLLANDLRATVYRHLGIDYNGRFPVFRCRPMPILPFGSPIEEILPASG